MSKFKIKKKVFISGIILSLVIGIITSLVISNSVEKRSQPIIINFLIIVLIATYAILKDTRFLSINKVIWYFCLIFMGIAPLYQYLSGFYPWSFFIQDSEIEKAQILALLFYLTYYLFYNYISKKFKFKFASKEVGLANYLCRKREFSTVMQINLLISVIAAFVLLVRLEGFMNLFIKSENKVDIENPTIRFIVKKFLSAYPAMACTVFIFNPKRYIGRIAMIIALIFTVLSNFPTSNPRYWMGTILIGLFLGLYMKRVESRKFDYAILMTILVFFPFFYVFKTKTLTEIFVGRYQHKGIISSFNTIDFDAFSMLARATKYVSDNGITWGRQLLNIILFFVPRSVWTGKPITTNTLITSAQGQRFTNLSCPLPAEGYVNFGIIGILSYSIVVAAFSGYLDKVYWEKSKEERNNIITMIYPYLSIIMLYVSRGPLQPSFIQTIAMVLPMIVIVGIFSKKTVLTTLQDFR